MVALCVGSGCDYGISHDYCGGGGRVDSGYGPEVAVEEERGATG